MQAFSEIVMNNLNSMLEYRGYIPTTFYKKENDMIFFEDKKNDDELVCVKFVDNEKINVDNIRIFVVYLDRHDINHGIIICKHEPSVQVMKEINALHITFEVFHTSQLNIDIRKHYFVPKHTILNEEETKQLRRKYDTPFSGYPKIKLNDAMAKYLGVKLGQIVKIHKKGEYITYRYVVK